MSDVHKVEKEEQKWYITAISATHWIASKTPSFGAHRFCPSDWPNAKFKLSRKSSCNSTLSTSSKRRVKKERRNRTGRVAQAWPPAAAVRAGCLSLSRPYKSPQISAPVLNTAGNLLWCGQRRGNSRDQLLRRDLPLQTCSLAASGEREDRFGEAEGGDGQQQARGMDLWPLMFFF